MKFLLKSTQLAFALPR